MGKNLKAVYRLFSVLLVALMLMSVVVCSVPAAADEPDISSETQSSTGDEQPEKQEEIKKTTEIAVVFDNSGSMFEWSYAHKVLVIPQTAWCQAKYAMEIFASMLDYDNGDRLKIFTMWPVADIDTPDDQTYRVDINNLNDIDKVTDMQTDLLGKGTTPFEPAVEAFEHLKTSDATNKWLIVLSDGEFTDVKRGAPENSKFSLQKNLEDMLGQGINVQYLYIGMTEPHDEVKKIKDYQKKYVLPKVPELKAKESKGLYVNTESSSKTMQKDLIEICNRIFQRSELPKKYIKKEKIELDISMKKVLVFVQGENAKINSLKDKDGNSVSVISDSEQRKYSTVSRVADDPSKYPVDKSLFGQVVTFGPCEKGKYTLDISGLNQDKLQIFYEPDVKIKLTLTDAEKKEKIIDLSSNEIDTIEEGEYIVNYSIVDSVTGKDVYDSELLGGKNDKSLEAFVKQSSDEARKPIKNGSKISLTADKDTSIEVEGTYLKKFKIKNDDTNAGKGLIVEPPKPDLEVKAEVLQSQSWYKISAHENWRPIRVDLSIEGKPLTDDQLKNVDLDILLEGISYRCEMVPGESAYNIYIAEDQSGKFVEPDVGKYEFKVKATFIEEFGRKLEGEDKGKFDVQTYDKFWIWLFWILIFAVIFAIWFAIMSQKVLPKKIIKDSASFSTMTAGDLGENFVDVEYRRKSRSLTITTIGSVAPDERCDVTFSLQPIDSRFKKSKDRRFKITNIYSSGTMVSINNLEYLPHENGNWVKGTFSDAQNPPPVAHDTKNPSVIIERGADATLSCRIKNQ